MHSQPALLKVTDAKAGAWLESLGVTPVFGGQRVLIWGAPAHAGCAPVPGFDPFCLARVVAFHDSVVGASWDVPFGRPDPVAIELAADVDVEAWAINGLHAHCALLGQLMPHIMRSECYQIIRYVLQHRVDMSISEMAGAYGLSTAQFYRNCKQYFGQTLKRQLRVIRAAAALLDGVGRRSTLTTVAMDHGYASASHFTFDVRNILGLPPRQVYNGITSTLHHEKNSLSLSAGAR